jgi:hypothetical protein
MSDKDKDDEKEDTNPNLKWDKSIDTMLENWADNAKCFEWMHTESYTRYSFRATSMSIIVNIS